MSDYGKLPRGIRNNNPGNLRRSVGPNPPVQVVDGFAVFPNVHDGCESLFYLIDQYYRHLGLRTLPAFLARYAPPSENDLHMYETQVAKRMNVSPAMIAQSDLFLNRPFRALDMARAIITVECGATPAGYQYGDEWVHPFTLADAMNATKAWPCL